MQSLPNYSPLERLTIPRPVDRIQFIAGACAQQSVLDLGAMDETAWQDKHGRGTWLHQEIARTALAVNGVDNSVMIPAEGLITGANAVIRRGDITDLAPLLSAFEGTPDVIVAGELIEHIENPLQFLKSFVNMKSLCGKSLILSTPNATALHNFLIGLASRESTHHDHLCIFSYKTLTTLCRRAGFVEWEIIPYYSRFTEMEERHSGLARFGIRAIQRMVNLVEWVFPILSFGYILRIRL